MDLSIAGVLILDGLTNGAVYALLGMGIVLVFAVTRIIFIPQGEFAAFGALTLAMFQAGSVPGTVWLLLILTAGAAMMEFVQVWRHSGTLRVAVRATLRLCWPPVLICIVSVWFASLSLHVIVHAVLALLIVTAYGPLIYRVAYQSIAGASTLVLLIVSVGVHFAMLGLGLLFFGAEGFRNQDFWDYRLSLGLFSLNGQALIIFAATAGLIVTLWVYFNRTISGKALRGTAVNRLGARLMGISTQLAGQRALGMAAFIGALSGLLIGPTTTVFYDSGLLIGLKGFVAAVIAGLVSFPGVLLGALGVGLIESFGSFWASAFKEVIVFTLVLPVLLWRSLKNSPSDEEH